MLPFFLYIIFSAGYDPKKVTYESVNDVTLLYNYTTHYQSKGCNFAISNSGYQNRITLNSIIVLLLKKQKDES